MSRPSRQAARRRRRPHRRSPRTFVERNALRLGVAVLLGTGLLVALALTVYALTRPPQLPEPKWPDFGARIDRKASDAVYPQQVWWRGQTWCSRNLRPADFRWSTAYRGGLLSLSKLPDGKTVLEITEGGGGGPIDGFGEERAEEVRELWRRKEARIVGRERVAGRDAFVVRKPRGDGPTDTEETWWIGVDDGITLGYRQREPGHTYVDWKVGRLEEGDRAPWTRRALGGLDEIVGGPYGYVAVGSAGDPTGQQTQFIPPEQHEAFAEVTSRAFTVCHVGSSPRAPEPRPVTPSAPPSTPVTSLPPEGAILPAQPSP